MPAPQPVAENYTQPDLEATKKGWRINGLDYQIVTKSEGWNQDQTKRRNEYQAGLNMNINYAAIAVPYDNVSKYTNYVADARFKGLKVWHRSHWNRWEGDNSASADMGRQEYLDDMYDFIVDNPTLFADGDLFSGCVECNNADSNSNYTFRTPENAGGAFDFAKYNGFLKNVVTYANAAFTVIGKSVGTWAASFSLSLMDLDGQQLDSNDTGNANGLGDLDIVNHFNGIVTVDHYLSDSYRYTDATKYWDRYSSDLDKIHTAFPSCQVFVGEWGYHTNTEIPESERAGMYRENLKVLRSKNYIIGVSFWNHMGQAQSSIFTDTGGTIITTGLLTPKEITHGFSTGNNTFGQRIRI